MLTLRKHQIHHLAIGIDKKTTNHIGDCVKRVEPDSWHLGGLYSCCEGEPAKYCLEKKNVEAINCKLSTKDFLQCY